MCPSGTARLLRSRKLMLRITAEKRDSVWVLKLEGKLQGEWVRELRRAWQGLLDTASPTTLRVELADVQFVDLAGKVLLAEMHRDGVEIIARGSLASAICDDIVTGSTANRNSWRNM